MFSARIKLIIMMFIVIESIYFINPSISPTYGFDPSNLNVLKNMTKALSSPGDSGNLETWLPYAQSVWGYGLACGQIGACADESPYKTSMDNYYNTTALGLTTRAIASTYMYQPASTTTYIADLGHRLGVPSSYAQGIGFTALSPLLTLWRAFRNIAYFILMIIMMALGIMIMFRMKLDPHTAIGIQNSLPKIIMTLIFITFSYPIAGLLVDLMYLSIIVSVWIIGQSTLIHQLPQADIPAIQAQALTGGIFGLMGPMFAVTPEILIQQMQKVGYVGGIIFMFTRLLSLASLSAGPGVILLSLFFGGTIVNGSIAGGLSWLIYIIIGFGLLFLLIRFLFMMVNAYIQILISIIFGPILIMFDAIPGSGGGGGHGGGGGSHFGNWLRNLIANLLVFPAVIVLLLVGRGITNALGNPNNLVGSNPLWAPPMVPQFNEGIARFVIGVGLIALIPSLVKQLKDALKAQSALNLGAGTPLAPFAQATQTAMGGLQFSYYANQLRHMFGGGGGDHHGGAHRQ